MWRLRGRTAASAEALKLLTASGRINPGLLTADIWHHSFRVLNVERRTDCPSCVERDFRHLDVRRGSVVTQLCGRDSVQVRLGQPQQMDLPGLARRLDGLGEVLHNEFLLRFKAEGRELVVFEDGRALVRGVTAPEEARRLYAKYIGV